MKYSVTNKEKEKRKISTCRMDEAFRIDKSWYIKFELYDSDIQNYQDFFVKHLVYDPPSNATCDDCDEYIAVMHLGSQSLAYIHGELVADEWADLSLSLLTK